MNSQSVEGFMKLRNCSLLLVICLFSLQAFAQDAKQQLNDQLWEAARKGDAAAVSALIDKGADVNAKFRYGTTALFKASERGNTEVVKVLLARGADVSVKDTFYGATAMSWALQNKHRDVVRALLEKDDSSTGEVLLTGARDGNAELVEIALAKGGLKAEQLTSALAATINDSEKTAIADTLRKAGAIPPLQLDAATLQSYVGKYKSEQGGEIVFTVKDGVLFATPSGQPPIGLMAIDKTSFKPVAFDGLTVIFTVEVTKVTGFTLKRGPNPTVYKRVE
jgi:ankyrin repeat protein